MEFNFFKKKEDKKELTELSRDYQRGNLRKSGQRTLKVKSNGSPTRNRAKKTSDIDKVFEPSDIPEHDKVEYDKKSGLFFCFSDDKLVFLGFEQKKTSKLVVFEFIKAKVEKGKKRDFLSQPISDACAIFLISKIRKRSESGSLAITKTVEMDKDSHLSRLFFDLVDSSMLAGASDIHIEVRSGGTLVRHRVHGELVVVKNWSSTLGKQICGVIFTVLCEQMQGLTFNPIESQFALVVREPSDNNQGVRMRVNSIPASSDGSGFDLVIRLLKMEAGEFDEPVPRLTELGYLEEQAMIIEDAMLERSGLMIIAGTTGSGKSTTLQTLLRKKIQEDPFSKVITIEDPVEYAIRGATQVPVSRKKGGDEFNDAIKASLRCDPDILMIGETRDEETAKLLSDAILTGHKTFSTVHAQSVIGTITRLESLGIDRNTMASKGFLSMLMFQALCPVFCDHCSNFVSGQISERLDETLSCIREICDLVGIAPDTSKIRVTVAENSKSCKFCHGTGVKGLTVVSEVVSPDIKFLRYLSKSEDFEAFSYWVKNGGVPVGLAAMKKVLNGTISISAAENVVGPFCKLLADFRACFSEELD